MDHPGKGGPFPGRQGEGEGGEDGDGPRGHAARVPCMIIASGWWKIRSPQTKIRMRGRRYEVLGIRDAWAPSKVRAADGDEGGEAAPRARGGDEAARAAPGKVRGGRPRRADELAEAAHEGARAQARGPAWETPEVEAHTVDWFEVRRALDVQCPTTCRQHP